MLRRELAEAREKAKGLTLQWDKEKASIDRVRGKDDNAPVGVMSTCAPSLVCTCGSRE